MFWYSNCLVCNKEFNIKQRRGFCSDECFEIGTEKRLERCRNKQKELRAKLKAKSTGRLNLNIKPIKNFTYYPVCELPIRESMKIQLKGKLNSADLTKTQHFKKRRVDGRMVTYDAVIVSTLELQKIILEVYNRYIKSNNKNSYGSALNYLEVYNILNERV